MSIENLSTSSLSNNSPPGASAKSPTSAIVDPLKSPAPVAPLEDNQTERMVPLAPETQRVLDSRVEEFIDEIVQHRPQSPAFQAKINALHQMGSNEIRQAASVSSRFLDRPTRTIESGFLDESSTVGHSLIELRETIESLDPVRYGDLLSPRKLLGFIPLGNRIRAYFLRYESSQSHINAVVRTLRRGQDELRKDNAAIDAEKAHLWTMMEQLQQYVYIGRQLDATLESRLAQWQVSDPDKARVVEEEMLFAVRQKVQDLLVQLAVSIQGYMALDIVRKNNLELLKGVERATTTTVAALRTAVTVAQALGNQKLVLDQVIALNQTTGTLIEATGKMLKSQSGEIQRQVTSTTVHLDQLQRAFNNIYVTMDMIRDYKVEALQTMHQTVDVLASEVERSQEYLARVQTDESSGGIDIATI